MRDAKDYRRYLHRLGSGVGPESVPQCGTGYRITTETVSAQGVTSKIESVTRLDGTEEPLAETNPVEGRTRTRIYKRISDSSYEFVTKANGKVTVTSRVEYAPDGKSRTITESGTRPDGQPVKNVIVWEKQ